MSEIDDRLEPPQTNPSQDDIPDKYRVDMQRLMAQKFKKMRKQQFRLTQQELANAKGVHKNTVSNIERTGNITCEELFVWTEVARRAAVVKGVGGAISKLSLPNLSMREFKLFLSNLW